MSFLKLLPCYQNCCKKIIYNIGHDSSACTEERKDSGSLGGGQHASVDDPITEDSREDQAKTQSEAASSGVKVLGCC